MKKYINQQDMKLANGIDVFNLVREKGPMTRKQLEEYTDLSWGAISNITSRLLEKSYLVETKVNSAAKAGRTPCYLAVNDNDYFILGFDINRSGFRSVVMNLKNQVVESLDTSIDCSDKDTLMNEIIRMISETISLCNNRRILAAGVALQGEVNAREGESYYFPDCRGWRNVPLAEILKQQFGIPFRIEHDPNCMLYAAAQHGRKTDSMLVRLDKGVGMAVMLDGEIINRPSMFELAHVTVVKNGITCSCGRKGCLECYVSQDGLTALSGIPFRTLAKNAENGDKEALSLFEKMTAHLSLAVSNAALLLNIKDIYICGDMCKYKDLFFASFSEQMKKEIENIHINILEPEIENAAVGAALMVVDNLSEMVTF